MEFGTASHFPPRYRKALFMADWQNGRILAATPTPLGASYAFEYEAFIEGAPLNVADFVFDSEGAMVFITGGRGSQSGLYRVSHVEPDRSPLPAEPEDARTWNARDLRKRLERFHTHRDPAAIDLAFPSLGSDDPWIRHAARLALQRQDPQQWRARALAATDPWTSVQCLMALARAGDKSDLQPMLKAFRRLPLEKLDRAQMLAALRSLQLTFIRLGKPASPEPLSGKLLQCYPNDSNAVNRELLELLVYLQNEAVLDRALGQLETQPTQEEQIFIARTLLHLVPGWRTEHKRQILIWLVEAKRFRGGRLLDTALENLRSDYLAKLSAPERTQLAELVAKVEANTPAPLVIEAPGAFVKAWTTADFAAGDLDPKNRDRAKGRRAAAASMCLVCHRLGDEGGQIGPDLSHVGARFDAHTLLQSIIEPSAVISPKYRSITYQLADGSTVSGLAAGVGGTKLRIETNPLTHDTIEIERAAIVSAKPSEVSPMPTGLINTLTREQILDLLAYLQSASGT